MWSPGSGRVHASGWVSSLSESSLTKSCQLSNCQWAIWVRQHLSEEFGLSTHQGKTPPTPLGWQIPSSSSKWEGIEVLVRLKEEPCHVPVSTFLAPHQLEKKVQTPSHGRRHPCLIIWPHLSSRSPPTLSSNDAELLDIRSVCTCTSGSKPLQILYPLPTIAFSLLPPPQLIHLFHSFALLY